MAALFAGLIFYLIATVSICAAAFVLGGRTERRVAAGFLITAAASMVVSSMGRTHWHGINWGVVVVDFAFLVWLTVVACRSERFWPIWAAASQLTGTMAHLPAWLLPNLPMKLYVSTQPFWAFPILVALAIGVWANRHHRSS